METNGASLKLGGALAVLGGCGYVVTLVIHGDLPDATAGIALAHIADRPEWPFLKLALIAAIFAWVGAFTALAASLARGAAWLLGRTAVACLLVGAAVVVVEYSILGHAIPRLAAAWQAASGPERERVLLIAETLLGAAGGMFLSFIAWLLGLPYLLMGLAVALDGGYPRWLGWPAVACGAGALFAGASRYAGFDLVPFPLLYASCVFPLNLWLAAVGIAMWRRGAAAARSG